MKYVVSSLFSITKKTFYHEHTKCGCSCFSSPICFFVDSLNFGCFSVVSFQAAVELEIIQQARMTLAKSPPGTTVGG